MTGEQLGKRGLALAAVGVVLAAWVVVFAVTTKVGNPPALLAAAVSAGLACACLVAAGVLAARLREADAAARWRHVFVVLECVVVAVFYTFLWATYTVEPVGEPDGWSPAVLLLLGAPTVTAMLVVGHLSKVMYRFVVEANGPVVQDDAASVQRIRVVGSVLVAVGIMLSVAVVAVSATDENQAWYLITGLLGTLVPVVLGLKFVRVYDVYSARRVKAALYLALTFAFVFPLSGIGSVSASPVTTLLGTVRLGVVVLVVSAVLIMREYTGEWGRSWRASR
ncbi:hypothetical protein [Lentzea sp. NPDC051838]|uniref:hypothetical protein n=1 Tax=Lentzea sp. NPDC051838 TaxID=3154849 RepID=UPI0034263CE7